MERFEVWIGRCLRYGVMSSAILIVTGWIWYIISAYRFLPTKPILLLPRTSQEWMFLVSQKSPLLMAGAGILLLLALPVLRVVFMLVWFLLKKDFIFVLFSFLVLAMIGLGIFLGKAL